ncbi:MAG: hypothetical protein LBR79_02545 [Oscillospiraceae bacterium]|jgi:hypothetical protein|nr:hypothetical protein [Oscillospiraceae bacterium]
MDTVVLSDRGWDTKYAAENAVKLAMGTDVENAVERAIEAAEDEIVAAVNKAYEDNVTDKENAAVVFDGRDYGRAGKVYYKKNPFAIIGRVREKMVTDIKVNAWRENGAAYNLIRNRNREYFINLVNILIENINFIKVHVKKRKYFNI